MKNILRILLALLVLASAVTLTAQVKQDKCPTCGKPYSQCSYHFNHPPAPKKCSTCGKTIDKCQYKGKHPAKCKTCGKTVDKCQYGGKHPKCSTCGKIVDKCQYGGTHPKCSTCGRIIDDCQYGGYHPKCSTCGKVVENCQYGGKHPKCSTCGKVIDNCQYRGDHPKCSTCGKTVDQCKYKGNHPEEMCPLENPTREQIIEWAKKYEKFCRREIREGGYTIPRDMMQNHPCLVYLILNSKSLEEPKEQQSWFDLYSLMNEDQIYRLYDILYREKHKLDRIKNGY